MFVPAFQTEIARSYVQSSTSDDPYKPMLARGRSVLKRVGVQGVGVDLQFLAYLLWWNLSKDNLDEDYLVVGEISDQVSDREAELLVEIEPALRARSASLPVRCRPR